MDNNYNRALALFKISYGAEPVRAVAGSRFAQPSRLERACSSPPVESHSPSSSGRALLVGFDGFNTSELAAFLNKSGYSSVEAQSDVKAAWSSVHDSTAGGAPYTLILINAETDLADLARLGCRLRSDHVSAYLLGEAPSNAYFSQQAEATHITFVDFFDLCKALLPQPLADPITI